MEMSDLLLERIISAIEKSAAASARQAETNERLSEAVNTLVPQISTAMELRIAKSDRYWRIATIVLGLVAVLTSTITAVVGSRERSANAVKPAVVHSQPAGGVQVQEPH